MGSSVSVALTLSFLVRVIADTYDNAYYEAILSYKDMDVKEQPFKSLLSVNKGDCGRLCLLDDKCSTLMFDNGTCSLFNWTPTRADKAKPGAKYFKEQDGCPFAEGFISVTSPRLCFKYYPDSKFWNDAEKECQRAGARLIAVNTEEKFNFLHETFIVQKGAQLVIVGLKRIGNNYIWLDGTTYIPKWDFGEPSRGSGEVCGMIRGDGLHDIVCSFDWSGPFICEISM